MKLAFFCCFFSCKLRTRTEGTIWEMRSLGTECNCGCVIHVAGDVNHSQDAYAVAQHWWPMRQHSVDSV